MSESRERVSLAHKITVLYNWSMNPHADTISALTEAQAKGASEFIDQAWQVIDRRSKRGVYKRRQLQ